MAFYLSACCRNPEHTIHVHPLLLSLTEIIKASHTNPDISTISENDERALKSKLYTLPSIFPPLEIHFPGQNGQSFLFNHYCNALTLIAGCWKCMASFSQNNSGGEGTQGNLATTSNTLKDNLAHIGSAHPSKPNKVRKCQCASSGAVQGNLSNTHGLKAAWLICRAKGKQAQKSNSWDINSLPSEGKSDKSSWECRDWEAEPSMFTGVPVWYFTDKMHCAPKA
jgi:hypothetical protein